MNIDTLIGQYLEPNPHRPGRDEARLKAYGVAVWALVAYFQAADRDVDRVAQDYAVPRAAVEAALAYYDRYQSIIDARIEANAAERSDTVQPPLAAR